MGNKKWGPGHDKKRARLTVPLRMNLLAPIGTGPVTLPHLPPRQEHSGATFLTLRRGRAIPTQGRFTFRKDGSTSRDGHATTRQGRATSRDVLTPLHRWHALVRK